MEKLANRKNAENYEAELVREVLEDFRKRQNERKPFEAQWQLNMNFLMGNQYCSISESGDVEEFSKQYFWQEREVFNHIAPIIETRLSKLGRVRPSLSVVPASGDEGDLKTARLSKKILDTVENNLNLSNLISEASKWSETCGSAFYKIVWNSDKGKSISKSCEDKNIMSGDVEIAVCPPFEIFPESSTCEGISSCKSIIHAKAYSTSQIKEIWGASVAGEELNVFSLDNGSSIGGLGYNASAKKITDSTRRDYALVIEKYVKASDEFANGRLIIIAGDKLLFDGELPFINESEGERGFPFAIQRAISQPGCFWGVSVIERIIPIQRVYNAVKNRKHEFLNRLSMGVLTVEDGSVDIDNLEEEGLSPGKILVYRQGSTPPSFMASGRVPVDFSIEEEKLLSEFMQISGVSDLFSGSSAALQNASGVTLELLIEQDDSRISSTADSIRCAIKIIAGQILRLYKQFASFPRLLKVVGEKGEVEMFYFSKSDISSDEIVFETDSEIGESLAQKRNMVFELLNKGLLLDENGKLSNRMRVKVLELLGFGVWESSQDMNELHIKKAAGENLNLLQGQKFEPSEIDDHTLHIGEHIAFMLGGSFEKAKKKNLDLEKNFLEHIRKHRIMKSLEQPVINEKM